MDDFNLHIEGFDDESWQQSLDSITGEHQTTSRQKSVEDQALLRPFLSQNSFYSPSSETALSPLTPDRFSNSYSPYTFPQFTQTPSPNIFYPDISTPETHYQNQNPASLAYDSVFRNLPPEEQVDAMREIEKGRLLSKEEVESRIQELVEVFYPPYIEKASRRSPEEFELFKLAYNNWFHFPQGTTSGFIQYMSRLPQISRSEESIRTSFVQWNRSCLPFTSWKNIQLHLIVNLREQFKSLIPPQPLTHEEIRQAKECYNNKLISAFDPIENHSHVKWEIIERIRRLVEDYYPCNGDHYLWTKKEEEVTKLAWKNWQFCEELGNEKLFSKFLAMLPQIHRRATAIQNRMKNYFQQENNRIEDINFELITKRPRLFNG
ncbi:MAG: hypothetical protein CMO81_05810 [Waddliaceae bacterium]|nr:hypothetical protein [Waddliaceae bacterium]